jgi:hypothetical protein
MAQTDIPTAGGTAALDAGTLGAFREVPFMGVIYVVAEAEKLGFTNGDRTAFALGVASST